MLTSLASSPALAVAGQEHSEHTAAQSVATGLPKVVRDASATCLPAEAEGYRLMFGCVSGPDYGAMGLHYVNLPLVLDGELDPARPEIVIYEPTPTGRSSSAPTT